MGRIEAACKPPFPVVSPMPSFAASRGSRTIAGNRPPSFIEI
jgi:hypothetical protein